MTEHPEASDDERIALNVRALREHKGMSQLALAHAMAGRGWQWHQQTVNKIENGARPLRAAELMALAEILQTSLDRFTWTSAEASETGMVHSAGARLRQQYEQAAEAVERLLTVHDTAGRVLEQRAGSKYPRVHEARRDVAARMEEYGLDQAIAEGIRRYEAHGTGEEP